MEYSVQELRFSDLTPEQIMAFCSQDHGDAGEGGNGHEIELSLARANELLSFPVLYLNECMALTTGLNTDPCGGKSFLCPEGQGLPAAERLLADMRFPLRRDEFVRWAENWMEYLPEATMSALVSVGLRAAQELVEITHARKNSREQTLMQVTCHLEDVCCLLESQGITLNRGLLPGTKAPYVAYLRTLTEFADRSPDTISDYLDDIPGYRWAKGRPNRCKTAHIFACLGMRQDDIPG